MDREYEIHAAQGGKEVSERVGVFLSQIGAVICSCAITEFLCFKQAEIFGAEEKVFLFASVT